MHLSGQANLGVTFLQMDGSFDNNTQPHSVLQNSMRVACKVSTYVCI